MAKENSIDTNGTSGTIENTTIPTIDPATIEQSGSAASAGSTDGSTPRRGRGRPPRNGTKSTSGNNTTSRSAKTVQSPVGIDSILFSIHLMMAGATKIDQLKLSEDEAKKLAKAINEVNSHYDVSLDPKILAWVGLVTTCVSIYAPRFALYKMSKAAKLTNNFKGDKKAQNTSIVPLTPTDQIEPPLPMSNIA